MNENHTITFNGQTYPKYGWCFIIAGGAGSGKSFFRAHNIPLNGKVFDLDAFKLYYKEILSQKGSKNIKSDLLKKAPSVLKKQEDLFINNQGKFLNNIIIDIVGRPEERGKSSIMERIGPVLKDVGYKIGFCWVVCNREVALQRNNSRERVVPDKALHTRHNQVNDFLPVFLQNERSNFIDEAWIAFTSGVGLNDTIPDSPIIPLQKNGNNGFIIAPEIQNKIKQILGPNEISKGFKPVTYLSNKEIKQNPNMNSYLRIPLNRETLQGLVTECIERLLTEALSDKLYHFTTINALNSISKYNSFICSSAVSGQRSVDKQLNKNYPFFLSFTRQHSNKMGYVQYKNSEAQNISMMLNVRISVDGQLLGTKYRGAPVNYHGIENKQSKQQQWANGDSLKLVQIRQSEDRLFSKTSIIPNADKYITRVDILIPVEAFNAKRRDTLETIARLLINSPFKNRIYIYNNELDFNINNDKNLINNEIIQRFSNSERGGYLIGDKNDNDYFNKNFKLKRGRAAKDYISEKNGMCANISNFIAILVLNSKKDINQVCEFVLQDYKKYVGETEYKKVFSKISKLAERNASQSTENGIDFFSFNRFCSNLRGENRIIFARCMEILEGVLRETNNQSFSALQTNARKSLDN